MNLPLFVYGTLADADLFAAVLGRPPRAGHFHAAFAPGFRTVTHAGRSEPALRRSPGGAAPGQLVTDLTSFERDLLDAFEGDAYVCGPLAVMVDVELFEADSHLPAVAVPASAVEWSLARWQAEHKPRVLGASRSRAAELRQRLIALRPH